MTQEQPITSSIRFACLPTLLGCQTSTIIISLNSLSSFSPVLRVFLDKRYLHFIHFIYSMERVLEESEMPLYCVVGCGQKCIEGISYYGLIASVSLSGLTILISLYNMVMHYTHFNNPYFQSKIIIILLLPPLFSISYCFAFWSFTITTYLDIARCVYQLLTVFAFFYLLFAFLGFDHQKGELDERKVYEIMRSENSAVAHQFPFSYFMKPYQVSNWRKAKYLANRCKSFVFRYIILKTAGFTILMLFQTASGLDYTVPKSIQSTVYWAVGIASYLAYYYLILLFNCLKKPLKPFRPGIKVFVIISTIFFILWQTMVFAIFEDDILACFNKNAASYHGQKIVHEFEHVLICLQMFFVVLVCGEAFSYEDYVVHQNRKIGSITFIIKDILSLFFTSIILIKPKGYGFSSNRDKTETQLQTISKSSKNGQTYSFRITRDMHQNRRENYF